MQQPQQAAQNVRLVLTSVDGLAIVFLFVCILNWASFPLDIPTFATTSHGLHCHLPIIKLPTNRDIAIAILVCKSGFRFYIGLVLQQKSDDDSLPLYVIGKSAAVRSGASTPAYLNDYRVDFAGTLVFASDTYDKDGEWPDEMHPLKSVSRRELRDNAPMLQ
jgi:hypothetical protein